MLDRLPLARPAADVARVLDDRPSAERVPPVGTLDPATALGRGRRDSIIAFLGVLGFGAVLAIVRARRTDRLDLELMAATQRLRHPVAESVMRAASWPGFPPQSRVIPPTIMLGLLAARLRVEALGLLLGWGTAILSAAVKAIMRRPRPVAGERLRVAVARVGGSSFPSGHVITYVGVYGFLAYLANTLVRPVAVQRAATGALLGLVALVGPSRVHQGHHWPTDVLASYLVGTGYLIALTGAYRRLKASRARPAGGAVRR